MESSLVNTLKISNNFPKGGYLSMREGSAMNVSRSRKEALLKRF